MRSAVGVRLGHGDGVAGAVGDCPAVVMWGRLGAVPGVGVAGLDSSWIGFEWIWIGGWIILDSTWACLK